MRKRKTPAATNPAIRNVQLLIDAEFIEKSGGWQHVITSFAGYIVNEKPAGSIIDAFRHFREESIKWFAHVEKIEATQDPDDDSDIDLDKLSEAEFERYISENFSVSQEHIDAGYFVQETTMGVRPDGTIGDINKIRVTLKGLDWIKKIAMDRGLI